jgi:hypothetical protein
MPVTDVRLHSASATCASEHPAAPIVLTASLYLPRNVAAPLPGLVVAHGAGSRRGSHADFSQAAADAGFAVLALDFRGHGDSEGTADGPLEDDLVVAARFLQKHRAVDGARLYCRGSSMGGFYALKAAATGLFRAVALLCPASEHLMLEGLGEIAARGDDTEVGAPGSAMGATAKGAEPPEPSGARGTRWDVPATEAYFRTQDSLALATRVTCPVLLVHARGDEVVPLAHSLALAEHLSGDATVVALAGGSHTSAQHDPAVHRLTTDWLLGH